MYESLIRKNTWGPLVEVQLYTQMLFSMHFCGSVCNSTPVFLHFCSFAVLWFQSSVVLVPVVQKVDSAIHRINHYPVDSTVGFANAYPLDSDLSGG